MLPFKIDLSNEIAVVTGGSGVLCSEMAKALGACGAKVAVMSRRQEAVDAIAAEIQAADGSAMGVSCDVTNLASIQAACQTVENIWGPCTILVNGAGGNHPKGTAGLEQPTADQIRDQVDQTFFGMQPEGLDFVFNLNYHGTVLACQVFGRGMVEAGRGTIINISSMSADRPLTKVMSYSNAKAAIDSFTQWLATHLAATGVRVNAISPGFFKTEQNRSLLENDDGSDTPRAAKIRAHTPIGRFGEPEELLGTLLWLVSDKASGFVTGTVIPVDGGFRACSI